MLRIKLATGLGVLCAAAALTMGPTMASAAGVDAAVFVGTTSTLSCSSSGLLPATPTCTGTGLPIIGGSGGYVFTTNGLVCEGLVSTDVPPEAGDPDVATSCSISSTGSYTNVICGTGLASGTANLSSGGDPDDSYTASYSIVFVGGIGVLTGSVTANGGDDNGATVAGVLSLSPTAALPPTGECVAGFDVAGVVATTS